MFEALRLALMSIKLKDSQTFQFAMRRIREATTSGGRFLWFSSAWCLACLSASELDAAAPSIANPEGVWEGQWSEDIVLELIEDIRLLPAGDDAATHLELFPLLVAIIHYSLPLIAESAQSEWDFELARMIDAYQTFDAVLRAELSAT